MPEQSESTSNSGAQWISFLLKSARKNNPLVPDEVFARLETLLEGQVSERDLTWTNLKTIATQLIGDMASKVSEPEETQ